MGRYSIEMMTLLERPVLTMSNNSIQILTYSSLEKQIAYWLILGSFNCKARSCYRSSLSQSRNSPRYIYSALKIPIKCNLGEGIQIDLNFLKIIFCSIIHHQVYYHKKSQIWLVWNDIIEASLYVRRSRWQ